MQTMISGITRALKEAGPKLGIQGNLMMNFLRHLGPEAALVTLKEVSGFTVTAGSDSLLLSLSWWQDELRVSQAEPFKAQITAVGLDSTELGWPPSLWAEAYRRAAEQGYRLSAHAGKPPRCCPCYAVASPGWRRHM